MALSQPSRARILEDDVCLPDLKPVEVKKRQLLRPERCLICESGTTCNHYNIPSCNKCKTFFRRAVLSSLSYDCPFDGECVIRHGLPFCKACRFRKCIKVGMRPDNISKIKSHQKESKQLKLQMIAELILTDELKDVNLKDLLYTNAKIDHLRNSTFFPYSQTKVVGDFLADPCVLGDSKKYILITQWPKHPDYLIFNEKLASQGIKQWAYMDAILAIELYKTLPVFYRLDPPDQENLVKSTLLQMCSFHPAYDAYFRKYTVDVVHPDGYHPFAKGDFKDNPLAISVRRGILPSCVKNHINKEKIVLLKMIIMLNSAAPNLSERAQELIATERIKYVKALIKAVQLDSSSTSWISRYQNVYNLIDQNLSVTNKMTQLFFSYYVPLISRDDGMAKLWLQLFFGRS
ncbi:hypothetical protein L596_030222 [Steinernema carpocapsae]|uniref:Nuclear receptor domain-containing protein n=1 Tax=Steinernema carpocapsae TaxID=34508 RepID=A0A4V5ZX85_STECR|nr:hypothetical protein L596_030222 [Steinernema carpocapsae]